MSLPKHYDFRGAEPKWQEFWEEEGIYRFHPEGPSPIYSIDTPPPTVSGALHIGHLFSYTHADVIARYRRMMGFRVFYPLGFDDNGLPTERLVEKIRGVRAHESDPEVFRGLCLEVCEEAEGEFRRIWKRLGLSVDWELCYSTSDRRSQRIAQRSFIELYVRGRIYRKEAPTLWCPECRTAIAQAEMKDEDRRARLVTIAFELEGGGSLPIATTRPELLGACVAVFVHPEDRRYGRLVGCFARTPLFRERVPILADEAADPSKGTGAVMCCTFGDTTDIQWWSSHGLPYRQVMDATGRMLPLSDTAPRASDCAGMRTAEAKEAIINDLHELGLISAQESVSQTVNTHERCETPIEFLMTPQWFLRVLDMKENLIEAGREINWHPSHMRKRYEHWIENLRWDWCLSRQRVSGVPFPVYHCDDCGAVVLAPKDHLPVDPRRDESPVPCTCGNRRLRGETDVMDTWATSSLAPQINARWGEDDEAVSSLLPMSMRPQAHDIIRTWTFYTVVKSLLHTGQVPWRDILISGHGLTGKAGRTGSEGRPKFEKISKSKTDSSDLCSFIECESADAIRHWACGVRPGRDIVFNRKDLSVGRRLVTKLSNAIRFSSARLTDYRAASCDLLIMDRWLLAKLAGAIRAATDAFEHCDYCGAKEATEAFFWRCLCDNYIEMAKDRLYDTSHTMRQGAAQTALCVAGLNTLKLFAPVMPFVTEELYRAVCTTGEDAGSIHLSSWPEAESSWDDPEAEEIGDVAVAIVGIVRQKKTEWKLSMGAPIGRVRISCPRIRGSVQEELVPDLLSASRAREIVFSGCAGTDWQRTTCGCAWVDAERQ